MLRTRQPSSPAMPFAVRLQSALPLAKKWLTLLKESKQLYIQTCAVWHASFLVCWQFWYFGMCFHIEVHQKYLILVRGNLKKRKRNTVIRKTSHRDFRVLCPPLGLCPPVTESCSIPSVFRHFRASNTQQAEQLHMHSNETHCHNQLIMFGQKNN